VVEDKLKKIENRSSTGNFCSNGDDWVTASAAMDLKNDQFAVKNFI
jgi:hypothetical protein